jgi:hypothetical protein
MDVITQNGFDHPKFDANASILMLMLHNFGANVSNLVRIPKKADVEVYVRLKERHENLQGEPLTFSFLKRKILGFSLCFPGVLSIVM